MRRQIVRSNMRHARGPGVPRWRRWLPLLAAALLGTAFAQTTITFWPSSNPEEIQFAKAIVTEWNAEHPELQVKMQPLPASRSTEEVLLAAIAARTTPDVAANIYPGAISQFVDAGGLYEHDSLPGFMEFMGERSGEAVLELYTHPSGHVFQIPWKANPVMFAYNVKLLEDRHLLRLPRRRTEGRRALER